MPRLDPQIELLLRAGDFCAAPGPATHEALAAATPAAREVYEILAPLGQQLVDAAERVGRAPPANWPLAIQGLAELLTDPRWAARRPTGYRDPTGEAA